MQGGQQDANGHSPQREIQAKKAGGRPMSKNTMGEYIDFEEVKLTLAGLTTENPAVSYPAVEKPLQSAASALLHDQRIIHEQRFSAAFSWFSSKICSYEGLSGLRIPRR